MTTFESDDLIGSDDRSSWSSRLWLRGRLWSYNILNHWLLSICGSGCNLSGGWLHSDNFRTHVLVFQNKLTLLALMDAIEENTLLNKEKDGTPDGTGNNDGIQEFLGLHLSSIFGHIRERVKPLFIWINLWTSSVRFLRFVRFVRRLRHILSVLLSVLHAMVTSMHTVVTSMLSTLVAPEPS